MLVPLRPEPKIMMFFTIYAIKVQCCPVKELHGDFYGAV
jgi:hypothetical protein